MATEKSSRPRAGAAMPGAGLSPSSRAMYETVQRSVVKVDTLGPVIGQDGAAVANQLAVGQGTGWAWGAPGCVVTNAHVVQGATTVQVSINGGRLWPAKVVGADCTFMDLAVLQVDAPPRVLASLVPLELVASASLCVGQAVFAVGHPKSGACRPTMGIINALERTTQVGVTAMKNIIQFSAMTYPGSSGSPLLNSEGQVIGICVGGKESVSVAMSVDGFYPALSKLYMRACFASDWRYLLPTWMGGGGASVPLPLTRSPAAVPTTKGAEKAVHTSVTEQARMAAFRKVSPSFVRLGVWRPAQRTTGTGATAAARDGSEQPEQELSVGSALLWDRQGRLLTNFITVQGASKVMIVMDDLDWPATVVRSDRTSDTALLQVEGPPELFADLQPASAFAAATARAVPAGGVGHQWVWAIGKPSGVEGYMSEGPIISTRHCKSHILTRGGKMELQGLNLTSHNTSVRGGGVLVLDSETGGCLGYTTTCGEGNGDVYFVSWAQVQKSMATMILKPPRASQRPRPSAARSSDI